MPLISLSDAMRSRPVPLALPTQWRELLGKIPKYEQWDCTIYGRWGSGKSSFALQLAKVLAMFGPLLYCNAEEKVSSGTIGSRAKMLKIFSKNIYFNDSNKISVLEKTLEKGCYNETVKEYVPWKYCIIDSVNRMKIVPDKDFSQLMGLEEKFTDTAFIFILHSTKDARTFRGPSDFGFDTEIVLEVVPAGAKKNENATVIVEKGRYGSVKRSQKIFTQSLK